MRSLHLRYFLFPRRLLRLLPHFRSLRPHSHFSLFLFCFYFHFILFHFSSIFRIFLSHISFFYLPYILYFFIFLYIFIFFSHFTPKRRKKWANVKIKAADRRPDPCSTIRRSSRSPSGDDNQITSTGL